jgi:hypothetical protein
VDSERCADALSVRLHAAESEMAGASLFQEFLAHALSVIGYGDFERVIEKQDSYSYIFGMRMPEGIRKGFAADAIDLVANERVDLAWLSLAAHLKVRQLR